MLLNIKKKIQFTGAKSIVRHIKTKVVMIILNLSDLAETTNDETFVIAIFPRMSTQVWYCRA